MNKQKFYPLIVHTPARDYINDLLGSTRTRAPSQIDYVGVTRYERSEKKIRSGENRLGSGAAAFRKFISARTRT